MALIGNDVMKIVFTLLAVFGLTGCISVNMDLESMKIGKSNPASEFCLQQKGFLDYQKDANGNTVGMCHLPNGKIIEEWQYYRQHHK